MTSKSVSEKMYLKNAKSMVVLNGTANPAVVDALPPALLEQDSAAADVVLAFTRDKAELEQFFPLAAARLAERGALWLAYRKASTGQTNINRDIINAYATERGITAVAIIALDEQWSALRLKRV